MASPGAERGGDTACNNNYPCTDAPMHAGMVTSGHGRTWHHRCPVNDQAISTKQTGLGSGANGSQERPSSFSNRKSHAPSVPAGHCAYSLLLLQAQESRTHTGSTLASLSYQNAPLHFRHSLTVVIILMSPTLVTPGFPFSSPFLFCSVLKFAALDLSRPRS